MHGGSGLLALILAAQGAVAEELSHRQRAERAETLGRAADAAVEYEAAWAEEKAPELLYRLAIARRKLRQYAAAKEALRGYLRAAPQGPLRDDVERQLQHLDVLIDAEHEAAAAGPAAPAPVVEPAAPPVAAPARRKRSQGGSKAPADALRRRAVPAPGADARAGTDDRKGAATGSGAAKLRPALETDLLDMSAPPIGSGVAPLAAGAVPFLPGASSNPAAPATDPSARELAAPAAAAPPAPAPAAPAAPAPAPALRPVDASSPALRIAAPPEAVAATPGHSALAPWLAGGAAAAGLAGGLLWWDGARGARDLDARFVSGDLTAGDRSRYARVRAESVAGRVLTLAAAGLAAAAVALWF